MSTFVLLEAVGHDLQGFGEETADVDPQARESSHPAFQTTADNDGDEQPGSENSQAGKERADSRVRQYELTH